MSGDSPYYPTPNELSNASNDLSNIPNDLSNIPNDLSNKLTPNELSNDLSNAVYQIIYRMQLSNFGTNGLP